MNRKSIPLVVAFFVFLFQALFVNAQPTTKSNKKENEGVSSTRIFGVKKGVPKLTYNLLQSATEIVCSYSTGTLPPPYAYSFKIIVKRNEVVLVVRQNYEDNPSYTQRAILSIEQYQQFLTDLDRLDIRKTSYRDPGYGGSSTSLRVKCEKTILFSGEEDVDMKVNKGNLLDTFMGILSPEMVAKIRELSR